VNVERSCSPVRACVAVSLPGWSAEPTGPSVAHSGASGARVWDDRVVPAGLDGVADPVSTPEREAVLAAAVRAIAGLDRPRVLVGIDGAPGTGKSTLADEVAVRLRAVGRAVVRSTTDSFHRPRTERYARGPTSPEGYYLDSHDLGAIREVLLEPFARGAPRVQVTQFDEPTDLPVPAFASVDRRAVLVFDGLFLQRPELCGFWDLSVYLRADRRRDAAWEQYLHGGLPTSEPDRHQEIARRLARARWPRYHQGWQLYLAETRPAERASLVIDNDDLGAPVLATPQGLG
jgi:uridine kinase